MAVRFRVSNNSMEMSFDFMLALFNPETQVASLVIWLPGCLKRGSLIETHFKLANMQIPRANPYMPTFPFHVQKCRLDTSQYVQWIDFEICERALKQIFEMPEWKGMHWVCSPEIHSPNISVNYSSLYLPSLSHSYCQYMQLHIAILQNYNPQKHLGG